MDKLTRSKVFDLTDFLNKGKIEFDRVDVDSGQAVLQLNDTIKIIGRSGHYPKYNDLGLTQDNFHKVTEKLFEINKALDLVDSSKRIEKQKLKRLMVNLDKSFTLNKDFQVLYKRNETFGGYTESRKKIALFDPERETLEQYLKIVPGINYHEMGHVFFTCSWKRLAKQMKKRYIEYDVNSGNYDDKEIDNIVGGIMQVANVMEDGRIENLMTKKISNCVSYFRATISEFLLDSIMERANAGEPIKELDCLLLAGRKYLDPKIRRWVFQEYLKNPDNDEDKAIRVNSYINKFITLAWRHDREEMMDLVIGFFLEFLKDDFEEQMKQYQQFADMIKEALGQMATQENQIGEESDDAEMDSDEQELLKKIMKDLAKDGVEVKGSKGQGKKDKKAKKDAKGNTPGGKKGDKKDNDRECHEQRPEAGEKDPDQVSASEVQQIAEETLKFDEDEINRRSADLKARLRKTEIKHDYNHRYADHEVDPEMRRAKKSLERYFQQLKTQCRNGYDTRRKSGTVDIGEARRGEWKRSTKIFRQYRRNVDSALDIEVAFLLDASYSMAGAPSSVSTSKIHEASRQLWVASEACKAVGASVKIFTFSDGDEGIIEQPKSKNEYRVPNYISGTTISPTMYYAENYLNCSQARTKWLIELTDGQLADPEEHNSILERMQQSGITCGKINLTANQWDDYYDPDANTNFDHSIHMVHNGQSFGSGQYNIVTFFKKIYEVSLKRGLKGRRG